MDRLRAGIVKICCGNSVGTGFILSHDGLLVTCAHVLGNAQEELITVFFYGDKNPYRASLEAAFWPESSKVDVAFLRLRGQLPKGIEPLFLGSSQGTKNHTISTFGFPLVDDIDGLPGRGEVLGHTTTNDDLPILTVRSQQITVGYSGAPIWNNYRQRVIGMISAITKPDQYSRLDDVVCVIPTEVLNNLRPDLHIQDFCPYPGLRPYMEQDTELFFGREQYTRELLEMLQKDKRLLIILGSVGSGKTSIVQAGVIPQLRKGIATMRSHTWEIAVFTPGTDPFSPLISAGIIDENKNLIDGVSTWMKHHQNRERLVWYIDQFEELFKFADAEQRRHFLDQLVLLLEKDLITLIIGMNDAYYSDLAEHTDFIKRAEQHLSNVPKMQYSEIIDIIQRPADVVQLQFDADLVTKIADETVQSTQEPKDRIQQRHSSVLPLLSFFLQQIYQEQKDYRVTYGDFEHVGGVTGALALWATRAYQSLHEQQQQIARRILVELVDLGDATSGRFDSCRQKTVSKLSRYSYERTAVEEVIEHFEQAHLLETTFDQQTGEKSIKIIHEALLREWNLLHDWLREDHQFLLWHREIEQRAYKWQQSSSNPQQRDPSYLLGGRLLVEATTYLAEHPGSFPLDQVELIEASVTTATEEERRKKYLEQMQKVQQITLAENVSAQALLLQEKDLTQLRTSVLLAIEALRRYPHVNADRALRRGLDLLPNLLRSFRLENTKKVLFSSQGHTLAALGDEGVKWIYNIHLYGELYGLVEARLPCTFACSLHGEYLLVGGHDRFAWLIDTITKRRLVRFEHRDNINSVAMTQEEPFFVATSSDDHRVLLWKLPDTSQLYRIAQGEQDMRNGELLHSFPHSGPVSVVTFSHDRLYIATSQNHIVRIWAKQTGIQADMYVCRTSIHTITFSPDDTCLAIVSTDGKALLWKWKQHSQRYWGRKQADITVLPYPGKITAASFSFDGHQLATMDTYTVSVWNTNESIEYQQFQHRSIVNALCFHPTDLLLAIATNDGLVNIWNTINHQHIQCIPHNGSATALAFHPSKPYIATASPKHIHLWEMSKSRTTINIPEEGKIVRLFFLKEDVYQLHAIQRKDDWLQIWRIDSKMTTAEKAYQFEYRPNITFTLNGERLILPDSHIIQSVFSEDSHFLATASSNGTLKIQNTVSYKETVWKTDEDILALALSQDGRYLAVASKTHNISIWDWQQTYFEPLKKISLEFNIQVLSFSPDTQHLIMIGDDNFVHIWTWQEQRKEHSYELKHNDAIRSVSISPDGYNLLVANKDGNAYVWDIKTGVLVYQLSHQEDVLEAIFSVDGRYIATTSKDGTAGIWETSTGNQMVSLPHEENVYMAAFSQDNKYIATVSDDGIHIWIWQPEDLIEKARLKLRENLTLKQWKDYFGNEPYQKAFTDLGWREHMLAASDS